MGEALTSPTGGRWEDADRSQRARCSRSAAPAVPFVGQDPAIVELLETVSEVAPSNAPVLITGESGTGKEILAHLIHQGSPRADRPCVAVNCGAIAPSLVESELFGHVQGAFTGAAQRRVGRLELAHRGTLFLDEVGDAPLDFQVKLLRALQSGEYAPVGAARPATADFRVVAATNRDLLQAVASGGFRADLLYRLDVVRLHVPPLRRRRGDIPLLVRHLVERHARNVGTSVPEIDDSFTSSLAAMDLPGNVRELSNYVQRALIRARGGVLTASLLSQTIAVPAPTSMPVNAAASTAATVQRPHERFHEAKRRLVDAFEREYLIGVLIESRGIVSRAAHRAGLSERGFHQKLRQHAIDGTSYRVADL